MLLLLLLLLKLDRSAGRLELPLLAVRCSHEIHHDESAKNKCEFGLPRLVDQT